MQVEALHFRKGGGPGDFPEGLPEEFFLALQAGRPEEAQEFGLLAGAGAELRQGGHGVPADFFAGVAQQLPQPEPRFFLLRRGAGLGKNDADGADEGHPFLPLAGGRAIEPGDLVIPQLPQASTRSRR